MRCAGCLTPPAALVASEPGPPGADSCRPDRLLLQVPARHTFRRSRDLRAIPCHLPLTGPSPDLPGIILPSLPAFRTLAAVRSGPATPHATRSCVACGGSGPPGSRPAWSPHSPVGQACGGTSTRWNGVARSPSAAPPNTVTDPCPAAGSAGHPAAGRRDPDRPTGTLPAQPPALVSTAPAAAPAATLPARRGNAAAPVRARGPWRPAPVAVGESGLEPAAHVGRVRGLFREALPRARSVRGRRQAPGACTVSQASWRKGTMSRCPPAAGSAWRSRSSAANGAGGSGPSGREGVPARTWIGSSIRWSA